MSPEVGFWIRTAPLPALFLGPHASEGAVKMQWIRVVEDRQTAVFIWWLVVKRLFFDIGAIRSSFALVFHC